MRSRVDEVEAMIQEIDVDGNGTIDFDEFVLVGGRRAGRSQVVVLRRSCSEDAFRARRVSFTRRAHVCRSWQGCSRQHLMAPCHVAAVLGQAEHHQRGRP